MLTDILADANEEPAEDEGLADECANGYDLPEDGLWHGVE